MTVADAIHDYRERCLPHLVRLRMLSASDAGSVPSPGVAAEVARATRAVLAQAEAANRVALAGAHVSRGDRGPRSFLAARLDRLTAAANDAVEAARSGNAADLRRRLLRFDALASAIWTAQGAARDWTVPGARAGGSRAGERRAEPSPAGQRPAGQHAGQRRSPRTGSPQSGAA